MSELIAMALRQELAVAQSLYTLLSSEQPHVCDKEHADWGPVVSAALNQSRLIRTIGRIENLEVPKVFGMVGTDRQVAEQTVAKARLHGHRVVNEIHLLVALFEMWPHVFSSVCVTLQQQRKASGFQGTVRQQDLQSLFAAADQVAAAEDVARAVSEAGLAQSDLMGRLQRYLASPYFPYGEAELDRFLDDFAHGRKDDVAVWGFIAHGTFRHAV